MLTALCSSKGSPGVTSAGLALAAAWPHQVALVEADEAGGDLPIRARTSTGQALPETPTVATLAAAARAQDHDPHLISRHACSLNEQVHVVPGFASTEAGSGMVSLWDSLAAGLEASEIDVLVDVGRVHSGSLAMRVVEAADVVVVVARADVASVVHLRDRVRHLSAALGRGRRKPAQLVPLVVSTVRHAVRDVDDVAEILAADQLRTAAPIYLAWDPAALERIEAGEDPRGRSLFKTNLIRSAQQAADQLLALRTPTMREALR